MSSEKLNKAEFDDWLNRRMKDTNLTPNEMKEFADWLENRRQNIEKELNAEAQSKSVTTNEFVELLGWLTKRFKERSKF